MLKKQNKIEGLDKYINPLDNSVQKLENFTNKALMLSEISNLTSKELEKKELNLREIILFAINNLMQKINNKGLSINVDEFSDKVNINGDDNYILKSFEFIIDNAIDYSHDNSEIEIKSMVNDKVIICEIINSGNGYSEEVLNDPEQAFYTDTSIGISLATVKKILDKHNGQLIIENIEDGSKVSFKFNH